MSQWLVPRLGAGRSSQGHQCQETERAAARREDRIHDWRISSGDRTRATRTRPREQNAAMTFDEFGRRARTGSPTRARLVPVWRDYLLDAETAVAAFAKLRRGGGPFAFLLESAPAGGETWARYTFMGSAPRAAWKLKDGVVHDWTSDRGWHNERRPVDPLADLEHLLRDPEPIETVPPEIGEFWSGAVGYFGYDVARAIERLP